MTAFNRREGFYGHPLLRAGAAGQRRRRGLCLRPGNCALSPRTARWASSRSPFLWRRSPRCSSVWPSACPPPGRPAFLACVSRFGARVGGSARRCFFLLSPPSRAARCWRPARSCPRWSGRSARPMPPVFHHHAAAGRWLAAHGARGLAAVGRALCALTPVLLVRLLCLPEGEAAFPGGAARPGAPRRAGRGVYAALNAAMMAGALPTLLALSARKRRACVALLVLLSACC